MKIDEKVIEWQSKYLDALKLAHGWDCNRLFAQAWTELAEELKTLAAEGNATPEQVTVLVGYLRALLESQERWLFREKAMLEAEGATIQ